MQKFFNKLVISPKKIFLIDSLGALLTAFFLFAILRTFNDYFGVPKVTLSFLSLIGVAFSVYSFCCFWLVNNNWRTFLWAVIVANLLYCCLTLGVVIYNYLQITFLGATYFLAEMVVVCTLVFVEIKVLITGNSK